MTRRRGVPRQGERSSFGRPALVVLVLLAAALLRPAPASAQAVQGVVVDDQNLSRVSTATVRLVQEDAVGRGTETDARGRFFLRLPGPGAYRLEVARLGYRTTRSQVFRVEGDDTVSVEFRVAPDAVVMDPITVTAHSARGRNLFEKHMDDWGKGVFVTPQQIDSMHLRAPADVFRKMPEVKMTWGWGALPGGGRGPIPSVASELGTGCLMYMVNRVWVTSSSDPGDQSPPSSPSRHLSKAARDTQGGGGDWTNYQLGDLLPEDVAAVEVFRSYSEVPPELRRYTHRFPAGNCGLVVFWTKSAW